MWRFAPSPWTVFRIVAVLVILGVFYACLQSFYFNAHHGPKPIDFSEKVQRAMYPGQNLRDDEHWGGYAITTEEPFHPSSVNMYFTVPKLTCSSSQDDAETSIWAGIGGIGSGDALFQTGVRAACIHGKDFYNAWWEVVPVLPANVVLPGKIEPGDKVIASISSPLVGKKYTFTSYTMTVKNETQNWSVSRTMQRADDGITTDVISPNAECIVERPGISGSTKSPPLANFGQIKVSGCKVQYDPQNNPKPGGWTANLGSTETAHSAQLWTDLLTFGCRETLGPPCQPYALPSRPSRLGSWTVKWYDAGTQL